MQEYIKQLTAKDCAYNDKLQLQIEGKIAALKALAVADGEVKVSVSQN